ncbi:hypothetical protein CAEBREN_01854 [Caenorhabditis brenneri]|uniref:Ubiquitin-like protease family profile domain-containing protein n=1 Tax=Caenorhabditis brenneri TaxID=135651 RepID=G0N7W4_CAEBE|nr:hypothetical protein CAEBREN_01854 [Caenorhabditis brenneri]
MLSVDQLSQYLDRLVPGMLLEFTKRKKMLDYFPILFALIAMVDYHNQKNPHNHFGLIDMTANQNLEDNLKEQLFFKKDNYKKYLCFVRKNEHFTVIYFDVDSKKVMQADSLYRYHFEEQKIRKIAKIINMSIDSIEELKESRIERQKRSSCGIHAIANGYMFLKYGTKIPLFHVKAYKLRDQVANFIWNFCEKFRDTKLTEEDIFGSEQRGIEYGVDFAPESSDEHDDQEEIDPREGERETFESKIIKLIYSGPENDFTDSEAASTAFSRASSRSLSSQPKKTNRRKQIPVPRTVEPEVIDISDDELPVQHLKNRRSNENESRTIEVITLSDDESSSSVSSEIFDSLAIGTVPSVKINVASKSASTKLDSRNAAAEDLDTVDQPIITHTLLKSCFDMTTAPESMESGDTETNNDDQTPDEDFEKESEEVIILERDTNETHDTVFVHQSQDKKDLSIDDLIEQVEEEALKGMQCSDALPTVLPILLQHGNVLGIIDSQNDFSQNGTDGSGAIDQPQQVHELEANEHLFHQSMDSDYEGSKEIPVENHDLIETSFDQLQAENASPNAEDQMEFDTDHHNDSNNKDDENSSRNNRKSDVLKQNDQIEIDQSSFGTDPPQQRTADTVHDLTHYPESFNFKKSARPHSPDLLHEMRFRASTRRTTRAQQAPKRPHNGEPPSSSDSPASSNKKMKVTWGLYTKGERNDDRLTRQKTTAIRNELGESTDLMDNTDPFRGVDWKVLKKRVLAAVQPKEVVWKNAQGHKLKQAWEEIGVEVMSKQLTYEELRPLRQILENTKNSLRRKIRKLVSEEVAPEEMEHHLEQWEGYEDCKFLRETLKDQEAECRLRHEEEKMKEQRKKERMAEKKEKKPKRK